MLIGTGLLSSVVLIHAVIDPGTWSAFGGALLQQSQSVNSARDVDDQLLYLLPSTLGDFVLRFVLASLLMATAVWRGWDWLAFVAATLAVPTFWLTRLAPLVAVPLLWREDRERHRFGG